MTVDPRRVAFWPQLSERTRKTRVSCTMFTTVLTNVHLCFPYPLPHHPSIVLLDRSDSLARALCTSPCRLFIRGSARSDYSDRTHGRGHSVPGVVSVIETRHLERHRFVNRPERRRLLRKFLCRCSVQATKIQSAGADFVAKAPLVGPLGRRNAGHFSRPSDVISGEEIVVSPRRNALLNAVTGTAMKRHRVAPSNHNNPSPAAARPCPNSRKSKSPA